MKLYMNRKCVCLPKSGMRLIYQHFTLSEVRLSFQKRLSTPDPSENMSIYLFYDHEVLQNMKNSSSLVFSFKIEESF